MEKKYYIQPLMETMVLPEGVMMQEPVPASGGSWPSDGPADPTGAPKKRWLF